MDNVSKHVCDECRSCGIDQPNENTKEKMLYWAVMSKHDKCMEALLRAGVNVNWVADSSFTPLMKAAENGYVRGVEKLIQAGADVNKRSEEDYTALTLAGFTGHDECLELLLNAGADVNIPTSCTDGNYTALHGAIISKNVRCVELLLNAGADVNIKSTYDSSGIHIALFGGSTDIVEMLLKAGADVNDSNFDDSRTNLMDAAGNGHYDTMKVLIKAGADVNGNGRDSTPLIDVIRMDTQEQNRIVASDKRSKCIELLVQAGADVNEEGREYFPGITPLSIAARNGFDAEIKHLIQAGADVNMVPDNGMTALMEVSRKDNTDTPITSYIKSLEVLIQAGADVNMSNYDNPGALIVASRNGFHEGVELLIQAGASVNKLWDLTDLSPLMVATENRHVKCAELIIEAGANVNLQNPDGLTALMCTYTKFPFFEYDENDQRSRELKETFDQLDHLGCGKLLLRSGAKINLRDRLSRKALHHQVAKYDGSKKSGDICWLLFAAGETLDGAPHEEILDRLKFNDVRLELKHICREAIRKHLLSLDPHSHLFNRIPQLHLPDLLTEYLLYGTSL